MCIRDSQAALERGAERVRGGLERGAERGLWTGAEAASAARRLQTGGGDGLADLAGCEVIIEAVPEDLGLKRRVFADLAAACGPGVILATNTSSLPVTEIAAGVPHPGRVVGLHFFNPPTRMQLVEVVAGAETDGSTLVPAEPMVRP